MSTMSSITSDRRGGGPSYTPPHTRGRLTQLSTFSLQPSSACSQDPCLLTSASLEHTTCVAWVYQALPPPPVLQLSSPVRPLHQLGPALMPSRTQVPAPPHSEACVLAHKWRLPPPNFAVSAPAAGTTMVFSGPPPSDGVQPWCRSCDFLFLGVPRSCQYRPRRRTATRPLSPSQPRGSKNSTPWRPGGRSSTPAPAGSLGQPLSVPGSTTSRRCPRTGPAAGARPGPESQLSQQRPPTGASIGSVRRPCGPQFHVGIRI
ncbi:hypothetical protein NDU88_003395 [Pleurodeles waltl]|uniref:Uncharacterized protein n=1 Tax=Pleurodeles waltl TaxID=8319 RepID=A0AAV7LRY9_PLEWA|nr:hypothetical protein NDU88_003395 [Pleurodeles waltl]